jgi:hypothetical protein
MHSRAPISEMECGLAPSSEGVRFGGKTGSDMLRRSSSQFDPMRTLLLRARL